MRSEYVAGTDKLGACQAMAAFRAGRGWISAAAGVVPALSPTAWTGHQPPVGLIRNIQFCGLVNCEVVP